MMNHIHLLHFSSKKNITLLTFLWLILCPFGHRQPSHIADFLIMQ